MDNIYLPKNELEKYKTGELSLNFYKYDENENCLVPKSEEEILSNIGSDEYFLYLASEIEEMETYLSDTDWYIIRQFETDKEVPDSILYTRDLYRDKISKFRSLQENANM